MGSIQKHKLPALIVALLLLGYATRATAAPLALVCSAYSGQVDVPYYSSAAMAIGGVAPYTFSISAGSGSLPPGLVFNSSTGAITGTPTTLGLFTFTAQVRDSSGNTAIDNCSITIVPALSLACPASTGQVHVPYSSAAVATGGLPPYIFSFSGSPPPGLTFNSSTGAITGTPTTLGLFTFTAQVRDSSGQIATDNCSITVAPQNTGYCTYSWGFYANRDSVVASLIPPTGLTVGSITYTLEEIEGICAQAGRWQRLGLAGPSVDRGSA